MKNGKEKLINRFKPATKTSIFLAAAFFLLIFGASKVQAATFYVDYANGNDANSGLTTAAPWQHCPGDANAAGNSSTQTLASGDKIIFKGGAVYSGLINLNWSGATDADSARIIYDGDSGNFAPRWGNGSARAIIDGANTYSQGFKSTGKDFVTINYFEIRNQKQISDNLDAWHTLGIWLDGPSQGDKVSNCYIHDVGYWQKDGTDENGGGTLFNTLEGGGILLNRANQAVVSGNEITKVGKEGIDLAESNNSLVENNVVHDYVCWGIDISAYAYDVADNIVRGNTVYNLFWYDKGFYTGPDSDPPHTDFVFVRDSSFGAHRPTRTIVEDNLFYNDYAFSDFGGTAMIFLSYAADTTIRNNVAINPHSFFAFDSFWTSTNSKIDNNTIYAPRTSGLRVDGNPAGTNADIRNNIFITSGNAIDFATADALTGSVSDHNLFYSVNGNQTIALNGGQSFKTFADWQAMNYDANSLNLPSIDSISFVNTAGFPANSSTMDLHLRSGSPAINAGVSISSFNTDKAGISRPQGSAWDIGAYELVSGVVIPPGDTTAPTVPTGLIASVISSSQINLSWSASTDAVGVTGYRIYRDGTPIAVSTVNSFSDTALSANTRYSYTVSATDAAGNPSVQSAAVAATTQAAPIVVPPAGGSSGGGSSSNSSGNSSPGSANPAPAQTPQSATGNSSATPSTAGQSQNAAANSASITSLAGATAYVVEQVTDSEAKNIFKINSFITLSSSEASAYSSVIASAGLVEQSVKQMIANFIHSGTPTTIILGSGERAGVIGSYRSAFGRLPLIVADWQDVIKIANGRWTTEKSPSAEAIAKQTFRKIYLRDPNMAQANDNAAVNIMAYGLRPTRRNLASEKIAILSFRFIFKKNPVSSAEWDAVRAIAYSGAKR